MGNQYFEGIYDRDSDTAYHFYATIQNKFHYAITGKTAAEIVYNQADHTKENMGLTTWKNARECDTFSVK